MSGEIIREMYFTATKTTYSRDGTFTRNKCKVSKEMIMILLGRYTLTLVPSKNLAIFIGDEREKYPSLVIKRAIYEIVINDPEFFKILTQKLIIDQIPEIWEVQISDVLTLTMLAKQLQ